jgi:uncharacterized protein
MGVLLRLAMFGLIAWMLLRFLQRTLGLQISVKRQDDQAAASFSADASAADAQVMRRCAWCKVHVPEGESTRSAGNYFCCEAHRDAFLRSQP